VGTKTQVVLKKNRKNKIKKNKKLILSGAPQKKATCLKVFVTSPKKPNSASRKVVKIVLSNKKKTFCHIPGIKHSLQKYSTIIFRGGRVRDLPGVKYKLIRNKFDLSQVYNRKKARSKYGIPKTDKPIKGEI
jgi:small subunit ribosomal protein S12